MPGFSLVPRKRLVVRFAYEQTRKAAQMRIAVCFFGITRNFGKFALDSINCNLLGPVAQLDPKFRKFAHFNRITKVTGKRSPENNVLVDSEEYKLLDCDLVALTDQDEVDQNIDFDHIKQYGDSWRNDFSSLKNLLRQFYSLNAVTDLLQRDGMAYDLVIFSRVDLRFEVPLRLPKIRPATLYTAWFDRFRGLNDRFGLGDLPTMVAYGRRQSMVRQYCTELKIPLTAEHYLLWCMKKQGIAAGFLTSLEFNRIRAQGKIIPIQNGSGAKLRFHLKRGLEVLRIRRLGNPNSRRDIGTDMS
jgi:hypothetical protein